MATQFDDTGAGTNVAFDNTRSFQAPPITTAVTNIGAAVLNRLKKEGGTMIGELTLSSSSPSGSLVAASKGYVDSVAAGTTDWHTAVRVATTSAKTLASEFENGDTIDGIVLATNDRILIKDQAAGAENGIYFVNASGAPTRALDADVTGEIVQGTQVAVTAGTANGGSTWRQTTSGTITIGTTAQVWALVDQGVPAGSITSTHLSSSLLDTSTDLDAGSAADTKVASQLAVKTYVDTAIAGVSGARESRAFVYQSGGTTYAVSSSGSVISSAATTAANNATVIQAAIDNIAGTLTDGHGGGGTVLLSDQNYSMGSYIELKPGVSLVGLGSFDRNAVPQGSVPVSPNVHAFYGTTLTPTNALSSFDVNPTGTTLTRNPVILCGRVRYTSTTATGAGTASASLPVADRTYFPQGTEDFGIRILNGGSGQTATVTSGNGTGAGTFTITPARTWSNGDTIELEQQSTTNPHAVRIMGINIDCRAEPTAQGILIVDSQFVHVLNCNIANAYSSGGVGVEVYSSVPPDEGAHGTRIDGCMIANCYDGVYGSGSGSTDSLLTNNRIVQYSNDGISLTHGGWQINGNHITSGSGSRYSINCGAPTTIINNYLDTTGNYHLYLDAICTVQSNIMKHGGGSTQAALVSMQSNGYKSVISGNVVQLGSSQVAFVKTANSINSLSTNASWRPVIVGNQVGDGSGAGAGATVTAVVVDSANAAMPEYPLAVEYKAPVRVATTANGTLATAFDEGSTVDGITLNLGDRILLKNQTTASENGIYTVNAAPAAPTRATDADAVGELGYGTAVRVTAGTTNAGKVFALGTTGVITPGSTSMTWYEDYPWPLMTTGSNAPNPRINNNVVVVSGW